MNPKEPAKMEQVPPGVALRNMRTDWRLGLRETARRAGISAGHLSDLEGCRRQLHPDMAARIADAIVGAA